MRIEYELIFEENCALLVVNRNYKVQLKNCLISVWL